MDSLLTFTSVFLENLFYVLDFYRFTITCLLLVVLILHISSFLNRLLFFKNLEANIKPIENYTEDDLPQLIKELEDLQNKFDLSAVNKHKLHDELVSCIQRLEAASMIVERYFKFECSKQFQETRKKKSSKKLKFTGHVNLNFFSN
jgi:hypothetical protein